MDNKNSGSRLMQMQARFQQKQMAERELKIASLYEAQQAKALGRVRQSPNTNGQSNHGVSSTHTSPQGQAPVPPGKVRQMFEERRTKGIDKSYPLQPIHNTVRVAPRRTNGLSKVTTTSTTKKSSIEKKTSKTTVLRHSTVSKQKTDNLLNGSSDVNHNHQPDLNGARRVNGHAGSIDEVDRGLSNYNIEDETFPDALAPLATPRTPEPTSPEPVRPPRRSPSVKDKPTNVVSPINPAPPARRVPSEKPATEKARGVMQRNTKPITKKSTVLSPSNLKSKSHNSPVTSANKNDPNSCSICGRTFAEDRLQKHEVICRKTNAGKKRKPFDVLKHRLAGTEAEPFINKIRKSVPGPAAPAQAAPQKKLNGNWRQKHEEFIAAIRAAKQVQAHIKAGGKLSDLPPPPPSENPDYVQCPHCNRRFNQGAAERHVPKCATYQFNKPKPQGKRK